MKCSACGVDNQETAVLCTGCGRPFKLDESAAGPMAAIPARRGPYAQLTIALFLSVAFTSIVLFSLAQATAIGNPNLFPKITAPIVIGLILTAFWAKRVWGEVLNREPESEAVFASRHRAFKRYGTIAAVLMLAVAIAGGVYSGNAQVQSRERYDRITAEVNDLTQRGLPVKQRFFAVAGREVRTLDEYIQRCNELGPVLNEYERFTQEMLVLFGRFEAEIQHLPEIVEAVKVTRTVARQDLQIMELMHQEITHASKLPELDTIERNKLIAEVLQPIQDRQDRVLAEQAEIVRSALNRGVSLPENIAALAR
jgi:hypothetical protein